MLLYFRNTLQICRIFAPISYVFSLKISSILSGMLLAYLPMGNIALNREVTK